MLNLLNCSVPAVSSLFNCQHTCVCGAESQTHISSMHCRPLNEGQWKLSTQGFRMLIHLPRSAFDMNPQWSDHNFLSIRSVRIELHTWFSKHPWCYGSSEWYLPVKQLLPTPPTIKSAQFSPLWFGDSTNLRLRPRCDILVDYQLSTNFPSSVCPDISLLLSIQTFAELYSTSSAAAQKDARDPSILLAHLCPTLSSTSNPQFSGLLNKWVVLRTYRQAGWNRMKRARLMGLYDDKYIKSMVTLTVLYLGSRGYKRACQESGLNSDWKFGHGRGALCAQMFKTRQLIGAEDSTPEG